MSDSPDPPAPEAEPPDEPLAEDEDDAIALRPGDRYGPVPVRYRHDGWVPDRQLEFVERLAECGCVDQAARAVGMSRNSAYALRRRPDAQAFRLAWDAAMDNAVARLRDAAMARAIEGVPVPIFHAGERVGERRHFDERLTMFLLRYRDPVHYGRWRDRVEARQRQDGPAWILAYRVMRMLRAAWTAFDAALRGEAPPAPEAEPVPADDDDDEAAGPAARRTWH
jgi:hypothetical protein